MYNRINLNSKNNTIENNSIFNKVNTNIITDYQRNMYIKELIKEQKNSALNKNNIKYNNNTQIYLNGTLEPDENFNYFQMQREKLNNNKVNYNTNTNKNYKNRPTLNRYNSYGRMNSNNNTINTHTNKQNTKNKKINIDNNRTQNKIQRMPIQQTPISNKKKSIIPLGNNKYKTIGDNSNYSYFGNKIIYNDSYTNRTFIQNPEHNTIDPNSLYSNKQNTITKKYNMKMAPNNLNFNYNQNNRKYNQKNNYNFKNIEISNPKRNRSKSRPKTPDFQKRGKSSSRFNLNNQRAKTPDRQRNRMKLNLNKEYLNTADAKPNKKINHYNYSNRDYNNTIDNTTNNKYKNQFKRLNTNDYFKIHKKTINNYDYRETTNKNNRTITTNNSHSKKYSYGKFNNNNQQNKKTKKLTKNCSQGNILANNYNINLNSNGINHVHKNTNNNYNNHYQSNTNLVTPIKYVNQKSNFKGEAALMTQIRAPNNYNIYDETFQSFGANIPTYFNNEKNKYYNKNSNITERNNNQNNNYFKLQRKDERELKPNYKMRIFEENNSNYQNKKEMNNFEIKREKNGNYNNTFVPATINNIGNKTYSYFNIKKDIKSNQKENINNDIRESNEITDIDFNDLDQFSPPYSKGEVDLTKNIDIKNKNNNIYMNLGIMQEQKNNYYEIGKRYDYENNSYLNENKDNRRVIDNFINQLKSKY